MTLQEIFDSLQENRSVTVRLPDARVANSLRVMLVKKWSKEKISREDLGFLTNDARYLGVAMEHGKIAEDNESQEFTFHLRPRVRSKVEYEIIPPTSADKE